MSPLIITLFFCLSLKVPGARTQPPNIIVMLADDLGWRDVSWHHQKMKTPHLKQLVDTGVITILYSWSSSRPTFSIFPFLGSTRVVEGPAEPVLFPPEVFSLASRPADRLLPPPPGSAEVWGGEVPRLRAGHQVPDPASVPPAGRVPESSGREMAPW